MATSKLLRQLPLLPLKNTVVFPHLFFPISAARHLSRAAIDTALASEDKSLITVTQRRIEDEDVTFDNIFKVGTRSSIKQITQSHNVVTILVSGIERVEITSLTTKDGYLLAEYKPFLMSPDDPVQVEALEANMLEIATNIQMLGRAKLSFGADKRDGTVSESETQISIPDIVASIKDPVAKAYLLATLIGLDYEKEQALLETKSATGTLKLMIEHLTHEQQVLEVRKQIASRTSSEMSKEQRQYVLRQQLRAIQAELGEESSGEADVEALKERIDDARLPPEVLPEVEREINRLTALPPSASEYQVIRSYIDLILELPWSKSTTDNLDLDRAREILDTDHHNLREVKDRIIEQLAVLKLNPKAKSPILCFVGPPGTGKTSLGQSIAKALGRVFERISLGGMHDEAELRGHRRTYVGAMPGRIIQGIRRAGVNNPLFMLDEIDKLGRDFRGDPAAALMEVLDPVQNVTFRDNYLDLNFDLSKVFFIATANSLETVPAPLLDRMEVLRLSGYTEEEKLVIAKKYLWPRQLELSGLSQVNLKIDDDAVKSIIRRYTREAGLRELERTLGRVCRKVAVQIAHGQVKSIEIHIENLSDYLGPEHFFEETAREKARIGVATGLAWTEYGGEVLYIETKLIKDHEGLTMTGQLGNVMRESIQAALSYVSSGELGTMDIPPKSGIHVHVPSGAIPKDGPSAGLAIATAIASLYTRRPMRTDTAMTGEITLSGLVLPVGGIKEKLLAARRAGIRRVILPRPNKKDLSDLPAEALKEMEILFVDEIRQGIDAALVEP